MLRTGQSPAPHRGRSSSTSTPGSRPTPGVLLPGTLASPRTGVAPAGCRKLVARLRRGVLLSLLLGARATGRTLRGNQPGSSFRLSAAPAEPRAGALAFRAPRGGTDGPVQSHARVRAMCEEAGSGPRRL